jgi:hypothetical protein
MATKKDDVQGGSGAHAFPPHLRLRPGLSSRRPGGIDAAIGKKMRAMYDDLLHQPIPDRFVELLRQIDRVRENKS